MEATDVVVLKYYLCFPNIFFTSDIINSPNKKKTSKENKRTNKEILFCPMTEM